MDLLEEIFGIYAQSLLREGRRLVEIKTLAFLVSLIKGGRQLALFYYLSVVSFIFLTAGLFAVVIEGVNQFQSTGGVYFDTVMVAGLGMALISSFFSVWFLNERRWISAFQLEHYFQKSSVGSMAPATPSTVSLNRDDLAVLVDELVKKRIKEFAKEAAKAPVSNEDETPQYRAG